MKHFSTYLKKAKNPKIYIPIALVVMVLLFILVKRGPSEQIEVVKGVDFTRQVSAAGKVVAAQNVELGFDQSGRVAGVYASVGNVVAAGKVLAVIENGDLRADLLQKQAAVEVAQSKLDALKRGTRPEKLAVTQSTVDSAQASLAQSRQSLIEAMKDTYTKSDDAIRGKVDQFMQNGRSSSPRITFVMNDSQLQISIQSGRVTMEKLLNDWEVMLDLLSPQTTDLSAAIAQTLANSQTVRAYLSDVGSAVSALSVNNNTALSQTTIDKYKSDIASARSSLDVAGSALANAQTTLKTSQTTLATAQAQLNLDKAGNSPEDIAVGEAEVKSAQADLQNAQSRVAKTVVTAPFSGTITRMDVKVGQVASPGQANISMISTAHFQVESYVPEVNIAMLKVGNQAAITLDAYGTTEAFPAVVAAIDPAETIRDGVSTYKVKFQFINDDERIKSGMTANINVVTDNRSGIVTISPRAIINKNDKVYVDVKGTDGKITEKEIITGAISSKGLIEVTSGLKEGDMVVINPAQ